MILLIFVKDQIIEICNILQLNTTLFWFASIKFIFLFFNAMNLSITASLSIDMWRWTCNRDHLDSHSSPTVETDYVFKTHQLHAWLVCTIDPTSRDWEWKTMKYVLRDLGLGSRDKELREIRSSRDSEYG